MQLAIDELKKAQKQRRLLKPINATQNISNKLLCNINNPGNFKNKFDMFIDTNLNNYRQLFGNDHHYDDFYNQSRDSKE